MKYFTDPGEPISVEASQDERGLTTYTVTYLAEAVEGAFDVLPRRYQGLPRTGASLSRQAPGIYHVVGSYVGAEVDGGDDGGDGDGDGDGAGGGPSPGGGPNDTANVTYELDVTQASQPIQVHPRFDSLKRTSGWTQLEDGTYGFPEYAPHRESDEDEFPVTLYGIVDWVDFGAIWRKTYLVGGSGSLPELSSIGTIDEPPGPVPNVDGDRNWLKVGAKARGRGNVWEVTEEWMLSGRGGWQSAIYRGGKS
jgi:hypothetical protein